MKSNSDMVGRRTPGSAHGVATLDANTKVVENPASAGQASGLATLNSSSLVVQNPANATATPTASKIPIASAAGDLNSWIVPASSGELTVAASSAYSFSHGLGQTPTKCSASLICKTAEAGYSIGDEVFAITSTGTAYEAIPLWWNATSVGYITDAYMVIYNKSTRARTSITYANWKLILRAWK